MKRKGNIDTVPDSLYTTPMKANRNLREETFHIVTQKLSPNQFTDDKYIRKQLTGTFFFSLGELGAKEERKNMNFFTV